MYETHRQSPLKGLKIFFRSRSMLSQLIIVNVVVFLIVNIINLVFFLIQGDININDNTTISKVITWFAVPSSLNDLLFKPWTLFTYMFLQENFMHLLFNMVVLYLGGSIFTQYLNNRQLLNTYLLGGIFGALFFIISFNIFPALSKHADNSVLFGASASVLAILVASATYVPNLKVNLIFFGAVKVKYIAIVLIVLDLVNISKGNSGGLIAHLGGAFWGYIYILRLKQGSDLSRYLPSIKWGKVYSYFYKNSSKSKFKHVHVNKRPYSDDEYNKVRVNKQEQIDKILEKISRSGYESLSKEEKTLLFDASKKN